MSRRGSGTRGGGRAEVERFSDPGEARSPLSRVVLGCGLGCGALLLLAGVVGIGLGAQRRLASWGGDEAADAGVSGEPEQARDGRGEPPALGGADPGSGGGPSGQPSAPPSMTALQDMQRRYRPGPFARVESMVPSGRLLPASVPGTVVAGRLIDTPWIVPGSELVPTPAPVASVGGPRVAHAPGEAAAAPLTVVTRTPSRVRVSAQDARGGTAVMAYLVEFEGYPGHFRLPATAPTELGAVSAAGSDGATVHFAILTPTMPNGGGVAPPGASFSVTMRVSAVDDSGRVSEPVTRPLSVAPVGAGDVEVTLTMGEPTDLDLYVTDPTGTTVFFGNTQASSGGHLDLDANAACSSNLGVNNEHIYFPAGRAPAGTYRVNVAHYENCIGGRAVRYRLTVRACGETVVLTGAFDAGSGLSERCFAGTPEQRSWCQQVVTFEVPPCAP